MHVAVFLMYMDTPHDIQIAVRSFVDICGLSESIDMIDSMYRIPQSLAVRSVAVCAIVRSPVELSAKTLNLCGVVHVKYGDRIWAFQ